MPSCIRAPPDALTTSSGDALGEGVLRGAGHLLADDRAHRAAHEPEVHDADGDRVAAHGAGAPDRRVAHAGRELGGGEPVRIGLLVHEPERIHGLEAGVVLRPGAAVEQLLESRRGRQPEVVAAASCRPAGSCRAAC